MTIIKSIIALLMGLTFSFASQAKSYHYECPATIALEPSNVAGDNWQVLSGDNNHPFSYQQLSTGHPSNKTFLRERAIELINHKGRKQRKMIFDISDYPSPVPQFYLTCYYRGTNAAITKPLDKKVVYCEMLESDTQKVTCWHKKQAGSDD